MTKIPPPSSPSPSASLSPSASSSSIQSNQTKNKLAGSPSQVAGPLGMLQSLSKNLGEFFNNHIKATLSPPSSNWAAVNTIYQEFPELQHLANSEVNVTSEGAALNIERDQLFPSQYLFDGQQYPEFDRSVQSLRCLDWIICGDQTAYQAFIEAQAEPKLSLESFKSLHTLYRNLDAVYSSKQGWKSGDLKHALQVALVMGDFGKSSKLSDQLRRDDADITAIDHDDFYAQLMQSDQALQKFDCFRKLPAPAKALLKNTADLAHFGHITHLEGGIQMFSKLEQCELLKREPEAFEFAWLVHLCDVAGALGHKCTKGSKVLNQATFENMALTHKACKQVVESSKTVKSVENAINLLVETRSRWLGIDTSDLDHEILSRLAAMMRITCFDQDKAKQLVAAYRSLPPDLKNKTRETLSIAAASQLPCTPTYVPALLNNAVAAAIAKEKNLQNALITSLTLLCQALSLYREGIDQGTTHKEVRLDFNHLSALISSGNPPAVSQLKVNPNSGEVRLQDNFQIAI